MKDRARVRVGDRVPDNKRMGTFGLTPTITSLRPSCSQKQNITLTQDRQARFYENYRKVADEYDKEFLKKYDQDLDTTLIFVSLVSSFPEPVLTRT